MLDELFIIRDLGRLDAAIDADQGALATMVEAVRATTAEVAAAKAHLTESEAALQASREQERTLSRRLHDYTKRRDDTRTLIDSGRAPDFAVAQRQWEQLQQITDGLETETLEAMEAREAAEAALAAAEARLTAGRAADTAARERYHAASPGLKARVAAQTGERPPLLGRLQPERRRQYEDLRTRSMEPLARIVRGNCSHCHQGVPPQVVNEVRTGRSIHLCRGCGRFFFDIREETGEEDSTEAEAED